MGRFYELSLGARPDHLRAARAERLKVSGNPAQYQDLSKFVSEQEQYRMLIFQSLLPWIELDVSDNDVTTAVAKIAD